jgi:hypothetical protein
VKETKSFIVCGPPDCPVSCIRNELKPRYTEALLLGKQIVVMGVNCNLLKTSCPEAKALLDTCSELQLVQLIKYSTRTASDTRLLDVIIISPSSKIESSVVVDIGLAITICPTVP